MKSLLKVKRRTELLQEVRGNLEKETNFKLSSKKTKEVGNFAEF